MTDRELVSLPVGSILVIHPYWHPRSPVIAEVRGHEGGHSKPALQVRVWWSNDNGSGKWLDEEHPIYSVYVLGGPIRTDISSQSGRLDEERVLDLLGAYLPSTSGLGRGDIIRVAYGSYRATQFALIAEVHSHYLMAFKYSVSSRSWTKVPKRIEKGDIRSPIESYDPPMLERLLAGGREQSEPLELI